MAGQDRPGFDSSATRTHPHEQKNQSARQTRNRLRRENRSHLQQAHQAAVPQQRHAFHRIRRRRQRAGDARLLLRPDEAAEDRIVADTTALPHPFHSGDELLKLCEDTGKSIAQIMFENEKAWRSESEIRNGLLAIWKAMSDCVARGMRESGVLPGGLKVQRRAPAMCAELKDRPEAALKDPLTILDWVNLYALAVNEENAAGGRVVTAPTNGAAGIIPAVLHYYHRFVPGANDLLNGTKIHWTLPLR